MKQTVDMLNTQNPNRDQPNKQRLDTVGLGDPICVLSVELDGDHTEKIRVYRNQKPDDIVDTFCRQFNLSDNGRRRLRDQVCYQVGMATKR